MNKEEKYLFDCINVAHKIFNTLYKKKYLTKKQRETVSYLLIKSLKKLEKEYEL